MFSFFNELNEKQKKFIEKCSLKENKLNQRTVQLLSKIVWLNTDLIVVKRP